MASTELEAGKIPSTKLWATASKEWVIAPKPKPGRKPKKESETYKGETEASATDSKGRRVQNRAAQRAFRERKQSQLAELQARIQSYEQGEIERNIALQNVAKRLKEENEALRIENKTLTAKLLELSQLFESTSEAGKKRPRSSSPSLQAENPEPKKARVQETSSPESTPSAPSYTAFSPPSLVSSPDANRGESPESHDSPFSYDSPPHISHSNTEHIVGFSESMHLSDLENNGLTFGCGFCTDASHCVCSDFLSDPIEVSDRISKEKASGGTFIPENTRPNALLPQSSILDNLPAYQPPVPLRRKTAGKPINKVFPVRPAPKPMSILALCSGDPSNCLACADDSFGKAFCSAMRDSVANETPCSSECAAGVDGDSRGCGGACCATQPSFRDKVEVPSPEHETIPTSDAWRQIKDHPNVSFADLALLADVVSRRSKCTGPRVVISPAPGSFTPERTVSPSQLKKQSLDDDTTLSSCRRTGATSFASPTPIPKEDWIRQRVCEVQRDAVETALHMLDNKFA